MKVSGVGRNVKEDLIIFRTLTIHYYAYKKELIFCRVLIKLKISTKIPYTSVLLSLSSPGFLMESEAVINNSANTNDG